MKIALVIALEDEAQGINGYPVYLSGCGKVNATIATMKAIYEGADLVINYGSAGAITDVKGLVEVTGAVDRDMDARALNCLLGETPFEKGVLIGTETIVCGTGDSFSTSKPEIECDIVDMEMYAIAKTCNKMGVEFRSFKYISDHVEHDGNQDHWDENKHRGNILFQELLNQEYGEPVDKPAHSRIGKDLDLL